VSEPTACPVCKQNITDVEEKDGVKKFFCDCVGFRRPVIEIHPPAAAVEAKPKLTKKEV